MLKMTSKRCVDCGNEFETDRPHYRICPACWREHYQIGARCCAIRDDLTPCNAWAMRDHAFCHSHMKQGYGLFELAIRRALESEKRHNEAEAKKSAEEDRKVADWHARRDNMVKDEARAAWLANGGAVKDFEKHWESIKAEVVKQKTVAHLANPQSAIRVNL